ncbi:MAG: diguanylate cyclase [Firmicutes bacterium]|nr:diguanylate cyclase [Bacillota bacterium]
MATEINKRLERARKLLEKNKLESAIEEYQAALAIEPNNAEVLQALGDLYSRQNQTTQALRYYGLLFDRCYEMGETNRAIILYQRYLKSAPQPPERVLRYATLLQKQERRDEAIEEYSTAAESFQAQGNRADAFRCWERLALLDPDNPERHLKLAEAGEALGQIEVAARAYFRAAQLEQASGHLDRALEHFAQANRLLPNERSLCLFYAEALLRKGEAAQAVALLEPFADGELDAQFQLVFGEALLRTGELDRARPLLEAYYRARGGSFEKLFQLAEAYLAAGRTAPGLEVLKNLKQELFSRKRQNEWIAEFDRIAEQFPNSLPLAEFGAQVFNELNREGKYFDFLARLFDLRLREGNVTGACDALDRLVDIDLYDHGHQQRLAALEGQAEPEFLGRIRSRLAQVSRSGATSAARVEPAGMTSTAPPGGEAERSGTLEDLIVQAEIFLQYGLGDKAVERLERIAQLFPDEEKRNERLRHLYEAANWWPAGSRRAPVAIPTASRDIRAANDRAETLRDLAKISEINQLIYRQGTPKAVLSAAVNEVGKYLRAARCLAVVGPPGQPPQVAAEFCAPGMEPSPPAQVVRLLARFEQTAPDALGGMTLEATVAPGLREIGLETALAVQLTDKETHTPAGLVIVGHAAPRVWQANEIYFLQAVGDQMLLSVQHTRLRTLLRTLAVADERTGLLSRSSYYDCLLNEAGRARLQGTPLALVLLQMDQGKEIARRQGEGVLERCFEPVAQKLQAAVRQNDLTVKYTAWSLAFILPDTNLANARTLAEKLRTIGAGMRPLGDQRPVTFSAAVVEAVARPDFENEDVVTDVINRAEFALEEARARGGNTVVALPSPVV